MQERISPLLLDSFVVDKVSCFGGQDAVLTAYARRIRPSSLSLHTYLYLETDESVVTFINVPFDNFYGVTVTDMVTGCEVSLLTD
ncbi:MAG: hypothetical protein R2795_10535 [Saprospiraceae bacterium]